MMPLFLFLLMLKISYQSPFVGINANRAEGEVAHSVLDTLIRHCCLFKMQDGNLFLFVLFQDACLLLLVKQRVKGIFFFFVVAFLFGFYFVFRYELCFGTFFPKLFMV